MRVSVIIPTLNSAATLAECLAAVRAQNFPRESLEIIIADAGSTDATIEIARGFGADKIVANPLKTGEAGKAAAVAHATGDLLALIDSDNIMPSADWLAQMTAPFDDPEIVASEPLEYTCRASDPEPTRYFALLGMNDPLCLFIGNYDRTCAITNRWTGLPVSSEDKNSFLKIRLDASRPLPTIGANGFIIRRSAIEGINWSPYWFDVDTVRDVAALLCNAGGPQVLRYIAKVRCGIIHLYCASMTDFARKQQRRVRDFLHFSPNRTPARPIPGTKKILLLGIIKFTLATLLYFPLVLQARRGNRRRPDTAWRLHTTACRITLRTYAAGTIRKLFGFNKPADRNTWKQ
ncbi:MAG: glycosyltransferase [Kiritimatiellaeota bacterium]|nr:glycosyltransferase [Kiritimatiellota bacterium]